MAPKAEITMKKKKACKNSVKFSNWAESTNGETAGTVYVNNAQFAEMGSPEAITVTVTAA